VAVRILIRREHERENNTISSSSKAEPSNELQPFPGTDKFGHFGSNYEAIDSLLDHMEQYPVLALNDCIFNASIAQKALKRTIKLDVERLVHHLCQLRTNSYAIHELVASDTSGRSQTLSQDRIAESIFATSSLLNHSCKPNTLLNYTGRILTIRAVENINAGSEVTNCYGPHVGHLGAKQRKESLKKQYFFDCICSACLEESEASPHSFACPTCSLPIKEGALGKESKLSKPYHCRRCKAEVDGSKLDTECQTANDLYKNARLVIDYLSEQEELHLERMKKPEEQLLQCLEIRKRTLYKYHPDIAQVEDALAQLYAVHEDYNNAAKHCKISIDIQKHLFGEESVEMGHEYFKLAQLLFNGGEALEAMNTIERAKLLLSKSYGSDYETMMELEKMRKVLLEHFEKTVGPYWST